MHLTVFLPLVILLLTQSVCANWFYGRDRTKNSTIANNMTYNITYTHYTGEDLGFNNSTNVCANATVRVDCCDAIPSAANCPVSEGRDNTSTYDAGAPLVDDFSGGGSVTTTADAGGATGGTFIQGNTAVKIGGGGWVGVVMGAMVAGVGAGGGW